MAELRLAGPSPAALGELARALKSKSNLISSKAARLTGEWNTAELIPELLTAFDRFFVNPEVSDKRCAAKIEILRALTKMSHDSPAVFRRGLRYVQMEPDWGGSIDTAAEVRALSAIGLAQTSDATALESILPLLLDPERPARVGAVRAISDSKLPGAMLVLRLKALTGDDPEVMGECFAGLLRAAPENSLAFVADFMTRGQEAVAEAAALALGETRSDRAFRLLREAGETTRNRSLRRTALLAIALLRRENAIDHLLEIVERGDASSSADAVAALDVYREDGQLRERLERALLNRTAE